ncbi:hypothetical protein [Alloactinosynnema sp. L-07]|uniref:hypothetical protein n=1 Tax=Alloactinosynnema sp. L-07 TaxID=1653480 RepID=UPI00065F049C|nr:hypothetical protein [Alloactinosynnema sp. L-07]CRK58523.1 hypothetical protein [Alloactinosynnema sp. L-07]
MTQLKVWHPPVVLDLALEVDPLVPDPLPVKADALFPLSKEAIKRRLLDELWRAKAATSPRSVVGVVLSEPILDAVRKELRGRTGHNCEAADLRKILAAASLRAELAT